MRLAACRTANSYPISPGYVSTLITHGCVCVGEGTFIVHLARSFSFCSLLDRPASVSPNPPVLTAALPFFRSAKGGHSKKKGPRTPSPPPPVPLDLPVVGKKHKGKHKNKERSEEKPKEGKERGRDAEKHKERGDMRKETGKRRQERGVRR